MTEPADRPTAAAMLGGRVWIGVAVSAVCVVLAARQVDWRATLAALGAAQPGLLLAGGLCMVTMHPECIGRGHRMAMLERFIAECRSLDGVVFDRLDRYLEAWVAPEHRGGQPVR